METIVAALAVLKAGAAYVAVSLTEFRENGLHVPREHDRVCSSSLSERRSPHA